VVRPRASPRYRTRHSMIPNSRQSVGRSRNIASGGPISPAAYWRVAGSTSMRTAVVVTGVKAAWLKRSFDTEYPPRASTGFHSVPSR